jgi:hypothetical protein
MRESMSSSDGSGRSYTPSTGRRLFIKRAGLTVLAAIPALQALAYPLEARAAEKNHCYSIYLTLVDSWCNCGTYINEYTKRCVLCGAVCGYFYENAGKC